ncbi:hypothetical protein KP509_25G064700 [Ceratopteris richardii]|uniref:Uncharacterized protein n=1 Tax=Ceratopteris richardii TaxID=49495 RepID=A0A8T2RTF3_CERRI|nr:hypothetical protein KP509_25G064700 [Ceratopteris richardii]
MSGRKGMDRLGMHSHVHSRLAGGSVDMCGFVAMQNVWGVHETLLSPPETRDHSTCSLESDGSSDDCDEYTFGLAEEIAQSMLEDDMAGGAADGEAYDTQVQPSKLPWGGQKVHPLPTSPQSTLSGIWGFNWETQYRDSDVSSPPTPLKGDGVDGSSQEPLRARSEEGVQGSRMGEPENEPDQRPPQHFRVQQPTARRSSLTPEWSYVSPTRRRVSSTGTRKGRTSESHVSRENVLSLAIEKALLEKKNRQNNGICSDVPEACKRFAASEDVNMAASHHPRRGRNVVTRGSGAGNRKGRKDQRSTSQLQFQQSNNSLSFGPKASRAELGGASGGPFRAVFLEAPASRESGGTGFFLPRRTGPSHQHSSHHRHSALKRQPACSTVLLPAHIVQALNLNVEDKLTSVTQDPSIPGNRPAYCFPLGVELRRQHPATRSSCPTPLQEVAPNISLPSEWTY